MFQGRPTRAQSVDRSGQVQAPDCGAPASRHGFSGELILLSVYRCQGFAAVVGRRTDAGWVGTTYGADRCWEGGRVMSGMRSFRSVFASVIFVALTAGPAFADGPSTITA